MNLNVTNIQIDGENVNEVLWVKSGETSIHTGMTIGTPLKFNVDEYTLENPGETAIITVKTDNNIYKDIELNRCVPKCDCDIFNVVCEGRKFVHQTGGTVDFSYSFDPDSVGKCSEEKFDCTTKADFVTITHNKESKIISARFAENFDVRRNARIVFSYGDENCDVFTITQGSLVDNCNKKLTLYKEPSTLTCQGGQVQFSVETSPIECNEAIKIKAKYNEVEVPNCGGDVKYEVVSTPTPVECNKYFLITTNTIVISYEGESSVFHVATEGGESFDINSLDWSFGNDIGGYRVISEDAIEVSFLPNEEHSAVTYTIRCEDEHGNCGTMSISQSKSPDGPCSISKALNRTILSSGENGLILFKYSADICSSGNFDISSDLPGVSYNFGEHDAGRIYFNIPANPRTEGRDIHITVTSRRGNLTETETYTFSQYGKAEQTGIKLILKNSTEENAYISGKVILFTNRQANSSASSRSKKIEAYFTNSDTQSTHNNIKLIPNQEIEVNISQEDMDLYREHTYFAKDSSSDDYKAIRIYHIRKRPQNITTGVEEAHDLIVANPIQGEVIMGETYYIDISEVKNNIRYWNAGIDASYPRLDEQTETKIRFKYEDGTCGTAIKTSTTDGDKWQDNDYIRCN